MDRKLFADEVVGSKEQKGGESQISSPDNIDLLPRAHTHNGDTPFNRNNTHFVLSYTF